MNISNMVWLSRTCQRAPTTVTAPAARNAVAGVSASSYSAATTSLVHAARLTSPPDAFGGRLVRAHDRLRLPQGSRKRTARIADNDRAGGERQRFSPGRIDKLPSRRGVGDHHVLQDIAIGAGLIGPVSRGVPRHQAHGLG